MSIEGDFRAHPGLTLSGTGTINSIAKKPGADAKAHFAAVHQATFRVGAPGSFGRAHLEVVLEGDNQIMLGVCDADFDVVTPRIPQSKHDPALAIAPSFTPHGWAYYPFNGGVYHGEPGTDTTAQGADVWRGAKHIVGVDRAIRLELDCRTGILYGAIAAAPPQ